ncbi:MAG: His-Xaa-Ser system protein HxsD [bacterium]
MTPKIETKKSEVRWDIGLSTYPMDAVFGASYVFLDRCYVYLDKTPDKRIAIVLRGKETLDREALEALAGEFSNELLHQVLRTRIAKRTGKVREMIIGRALFSAEGPAASEDEFDYDDFGDDADYLDDPLGIAVPWEEKYGSEEGQEPGEGGKGATDPAAD